MPTHTEVNWTLPEKTRLQWNNTIQGLEWQATSVRSPKETWTITLNASHATYEVRCTAEIKTEIFYNFEAAKVYAHLCDDDIPLIIRD